MRSLAQRVIQDYGSFEEYERLNKIENEKEAIILLKSYNKKLKYGRKSSSKKGYKKRYLHLKFISINDLI